MKLPALLIAASLVVSLLAFASVRAAPVPAESHISAVAVYTDRAVITRTANIALPHPGVVELVFERLPEALIDQSLQVSGTGRAQVTLLDVTARTAFIDFTPNDRVKGLEDQLRQLEQEDRTLADRATVLGQQRDYVLKIQQATAASPQNGPTFATTPETWLQLLAFSEDQLSKLASQVREVDAQRDALRLQRAALQQELDQLRGSGGRSYKTVAVRLDVASVDAFELTLRYAVSDASWTPAYDARASSSERSVQLGYFGMVRQQTGEDWSNVALTLSTARPALGGAAPDLQPWVVQHREFIPLPAAAPAAFDAMMAPEPTISGYARGATMLRQKEAPSRYAQASIQTQATSASFNVAAPTTIPSDNSPQKVPIAALKLATTAEYRTAPKLAASAFLTAKVTNTSEYPLLNGAMNVFLDDNFVAASTVGTTMPGEKFDLALGADEGISVKRTLNNRFTEDVGVVHKSERITYSITTVVQNNKRTTETVVVHDQLPVSRHEKIVVKQLTPDERQLKPDIDGLLKWTFDLKPGEKRELPLKFSIEHPADFNITGLE